MYTATLNYWLLVDLGWNRPRNSLVNGDCQQFVGICDSLQTLLINVRPINSVEFLVVWCVIVRKNIQQHTTYSIPRSPCSPCAPVPASTSTVPSSRCTARTAWLLVSHTASTLLDSQHSPCGQLNRASDTSDNAKQYIFKNWLTMNLICKCMFFYEILRIYIDKKQWITWQLTSIFKTRIRASNDFQYNPGAIREQNAMVASVG